MVRVWFFENAVWCEHGRDVSDDTASTITILPCLFCLFELLVAAAAAVAALALCCCLSCVGGFVFFRPRGCIVSSFFIFFHFFLLFLCMALLELDLDTSRSCSVFFFPCLFFSSPLSRTVSFMVVSCIALGLEDDI